MQDTTLTAYYMDAANVMRKVSASYIEPSAQDIEDGHSAVLEFLRKECGYIPVRVLLSVLGGKA